VIEACNEVVSLHTSYYVKEIVFNSLPQSSRGVMSKPIINFKTVNHQYAYAILVKTSSCLYLVQYDVHWGGHWGGGAA